MMRLDEIGLRLHDLQTCDDLPSAQELLVLGEQSLHPLALGRSLVRGHRGSTRRSSVGLLPLCRRYDHDTSLSGLPASH